MEITIAFVFIVCLLVGFLLGGIGIALWGLSRSCVAASSSINLQTLMAGLITVLMVGGSGVWLSYSAAAPGIGSTTSVDFIDSVKTAAAFGLAPGLGFLSAGLFSYIKSIVRWQRTS